MSYLEEEKLTKVTGANMARVTGGHMARVTNGDRELGPDKVALLMERLRVPASEQAIFLLLGGGLPEVTATSWLDDLQRTTTPVGEPTISETLKKYIPDRREVLKLASAMGKDGTALYKHWLGDKLRKSIDFKIRLELCERLPMPIEEKVQFFLTAAGFDREVVRIALENYRNPSQEIQEIEEVLTSKQEEIVAAGYKPNSIAVRWNIDPTA